MVVIIDDAVTSGESILMEIDAVQQAEHTALEDPRVRSQYRPGPSAGRTKGPLPAAGDAGRHPRTIAAEIA